MHKTAQTDPALVDTALSEFSNTAQDLQRVALHDLVVLANECAAKEAEIERHYHAAVQENEAEFHKASEQIDRRRDELLAEFHRKHEEFLAQIKFQYESDRAKLHTSDQSARQRTELEHTTADRDVKKKLTQAAWLAETVLESTLNQLRADAKQAQQEYTVRRKALGDLEEQAASVMLAFGQEWLVAEEDDQSEQSESTPPDESDEVADVFNPKRELAQQSLDVLANLRLPRLTSGILPFLVVLLASVLTAGAAQLIAATRVPQWKEMGIAAGIVALAMTVASFMLRRKAVAQLWEAAMNLREAIDQTRLAADAEYRKAIRLREIRQAEAAAQERQRGSRGKRTLRTDSQPGGPDTRGFTENDRGRT